MNCKKCGSQMTNGQIICSNCDADNSDNVFNENYDINEFTKDINQNTYEEKIDNNFSNDYSSETNYETFEKPKRNNYMLFFILLFIFIAVITFIFLNNKTIFLSNNKHVDVINSYKLLKRQVKENITLGGVVACDEDCNFVYDFDNNIYDFEVIDMGSYYKLEFEVEDDYIDDFKFTSDSCKNLEDSICHDNEIVGSVDK